MPASGGGPHQAGGGPVVALVAALERDGARLGFDGVEILLTQWARAEGKPVFGVGKDSNIISAAIKALLNGVNRHERTSS